MYFLKLYDVNKITELSTYSYALVEIHGTFRPFFYPMGFIYV